MHLAQCSLEIAGKVDYSYTGQLTFKQLVERHGPAAALPDGNDDLVHLELAYRLDERDVRWNQPALRNPSYCISANGVEADDPEITGTQRLLHCLRLGACAEHDHTTWQHRRKARMCCVDPKRYDRAQREQGRRLQELVVSAVRRKLVENRIC